MGDDILDESKQLLATVPYELNCGLIIIPGADNWHGFQKCPINDVRKAVIANYVKDEWRDWYQLASPDQPVG